MRLIPHLALIDVCEMCKDGNWIMSVLITLAPSAILATEGSLFLFQLWESQEEVNGKL